MSTFRLNDPEKKNEHLMRIFVDYSLKLAFFRNQKMKKDLMRPLYDRYRTIKRMIAKPMSVRTFHLNISNIFLINKCLYIYFHFNIFQYFLAFKCEIVS